MGSWNMGGNISCAVKHTTYKDAVDVQTLSRIPSIGRQCFGGSLAMSLPHPMGSFVPILFSARFVFAHIHFALWRYHNRPDQNDSFFMGQNLFCYV